MEPGWAADVLVAIYMALLTELGQGYGMCVASLPHAAFRG
jgi:hypothetical protein